jgi:AraC-like DNA-binding protein
MSLLVRSLGVSYLDGHQINEHLHHWGQLVYASSGAIQVVAERVCWLVPSARAVWVPPRAHHQLTMRGETSLKTVYLEPGLCSDLPARCHGLEVQPLLRELIVHIVDSGYLDSSVRQQALLAELLEMLLREAAVLPLSLRLPNDARARRAAQQIQKDPAAPLTLARLAGSVGLSVRTLQRLFLEETGMHAGEWRQTARMMAATATLLEGASVTDASLAAGYATPSAFISAFQQRTGRTPLEYRLQTPLR